MGKEESCWISTGYEVRKERMPLCLMEIKIVNLQRAEFKYSHKIKIIHLAEMYLQQLRMLLSSLYVGTCS